MMTCENCGAQLQTIDHMDGEPFEWCYDCGPDLDEREPPAERQRGDDEDRDS